MKRSLFGLAAILAIGALANAGDVSASRLAMDLPPLQPPRLAMDLPPLQPPRLA